MQAFRWTQATGMVGLGDLASGTCFRQAYAVSADGEVVVGFGNKSGEDGAFMWTEEQGVRNIRDILVNECNLDLAGWSLSEATGVSADGRTIVGYGLNPDGNTEAWIATLPEPATLSLLAVGGLLALRRRR